MGWFNDSDMLLMRKLNESGKSHLREQGQSTRHSTGDGTWHESRHKDDFQGSIFFFYLLLFHLYVRGFLLELLTAGLFPDIVLHAAL